MARIVIAGAGAIGASIAYQLALRGADDVVLADRAEIASGSTGKAMGGVRQQFSTEAEVRLARESIGFFQELGSPFFDQVGYLFFATTEEGLADARAPRGAPAWPRAFRSSASTRRDRGAERGRRAGSGRLLGGRRRRARRGRPRARPAGGGAWRRGSRGRRCARARAGRPRDRGRCVLARALARPADPPALPPARRRRPGRGPARRPADDPRGRDRIPLPAARRHAAAGDERADAALDRPRGGRRGARRGLARAARARGIRPRPARRSFGRGPGSTT